MDIRMTEEDYEIIKGKGLHLICKDYRQYERNKTGQKTIELPRP